MEHKKNDPECALAPEHFDFNINFLINFINIIDFYTTFYLTCICISQNFFGST